MICLLDSQLRYCVVSSKVHIGAVEMAVIINVPEFFTYHRSKRCEWDDIISPKIVCSIG